MKPGATTRSRASRVAGAPDRPCPTATMRSPAIPMSARNAGRPVPSTTRPLAMIRSRVGSASAAVARSITQVPDRLEALLVDLQIVRPLPAARAPGVGLARMSVAAVHDVVPDAVLPAEKVGVRRTVFALEEAPAPRPAGLLLPRRVRRIDGPELSPRCA